MSNVINNQVALASALDRLRKSNAILGLGLEDSTINSHEVEAYMQRAIGEDVEKDMRLENKIKAAVYLAAKRSNWKPGWSAKYLAELSTQALRDARLISLYETNRIGAKQYKEECEKNVVTNTISVAKRLNKRAKRIAIKSLLTTGLALTVGGPVSAIAGSIMLASELIPYETKRKIKKKVKTVAKEAGEVIVQTTRRLYESGRKVAKKVADKVTEIGEKIVDRTVQYAAPIVDTICDVGRSIVQGTKEVAKKVWEFFTGRK